MVLGMTNLVGAEKIEVIVGTKRSQHYHCGNASRYSRTAYILHSQDCLDSGIDLRKCSFSLALDAKGIDRHKWYGMEDRPMVLDIEDGYIVPVCPLNSLSALSVFDYPYLVPINHQPEDENE